MREISIMDFPGMTTLRSGTGVLSGMERLANWNASVATIVISSPSSIKTPVRIGLLSSCAVANTVVLIMSRQSE